MIPMLLWRCPICQTHDALTHLARRFRADRVTCAHCDAAWRVRRVLGDNYYLKRIDSSTGEEDERSITAWYDAMKQGLALAPVADAEMAPEPDERLYLASAEIELYVEETDPLFFPDGQGRLDKVEKRQVTGASVGTGRLFLTDRRVVWQAARSPDGERDPVSFPLQRVSSAYAMMDFGIALMVGMRLYAAYLRQESPLKWVSYLGLVADQVRTETGHQIATSHY